MANHFLDLVIWLLEQVPSAVNATNSFGRSCLHLAAINNNIEMCKILIDYGAEVNTVMKTKGQFITPLDAALQKGHRDVAKYLLLHGASPASKMNLPQSSNLGQIMIKHHENSSPDSVSPSHTFFSQMRNANKNNLILMQRNDNDDSSKAELIDVHHSTLPKLPSLVTKKDFHNGKSSLITHDNKLKNIREINTQLNEGVSTLKQAIITNVYVTKTPIRSKRVPPLKKTKRKKRSGHEVTSEQDLDIRGYTDSQASTTIDSQFSINSEENSIYETYTITEVDNQIDDNQHLIDQTFPKTNIIKKVENDKTTITLKELDQKSFEDSFNVIDEMRRHFFITDDGIRIIDDDHPNCALKQIDNNERKKEKSEIDDKEAKKKLHSDKKSSNREKSKIQKSDSKSIKDSRNGTQVKNKDKQTSKVHTVKKQEKPLRKQYSIEDKNSKSEPKSQKTKVDTKVRTESKQRSKRSPSDDKVGLKKRDKKQGVKGTMKSDETMEDRKLLLPIGVIEQKRDKKVMKSGKETQSQPEKFIEEKETEDIELKKSYEESYEQDFEKDGESQELVRQDYEQHEQEETTEQGQKFDLDYATESEMPYEHKSELLEVIDENESKDITRTGSIDEKSEIELDENVINKQASRELADEESGVSYKEIEEIAVDSKEFEIHKEERDLKEAEDLDQTKETEEVYEDSKEQIQQNEEFKDDESDLKELYKEKREIDYNENEITDSQVYTDKEKDVIENFTEEIKLDEKTKSDQDEETYEKFYEKIEQFESHSPEISQYEDETEKRDKSDIQNEGEEKSELVNRKNSDNSLSQEIPIAFANEASPIDNSIALDEELNTAIYQKSVDEQSQDHVESEFEQVQNSNGKNKVDEKVVGISNVDQTLRNHNTDLYYEPERFDSRCNHKLHLKTTPAHVGHVETSHIEAKVDTRRKGQFRPNTKADFETRSYHGKEKVKYKRPRSGSDTFRSVDPNLITQTVERSLRK